MEWAPTKINEKSKLNGKLERNGQTFAFGVGNIFSAAKSQHVIQPLRINDIHIPSMSEESYFELKIDRHKEQLMSYARAMQFYISYNATYYRISVRVVDSVPLTYVND